MGGGGEGELQVYQLANVCSLKEVQTSDTLIIFCFVIKIIK